MAPLGPHLYVPIKKESWLLQANCNKYRRQCVEKESLAFLDKSSQWLSMDKVYDAQTIDEMARSIGYLLKVDPRRAMAVANLVTSLTSTGRACSHLMRLYSFFPSDELLQKIGEQNRLRVQRDPNYLDSYTIEMAYFYGSIGLYEKAVEEYERVPRDHHELLLLHVNLANSLLGQGRSAEAIDEYKLAFEQYWRIENPLLGAANAGFNPLAEAHKLTHLLRKSGKQSEADRFLFDVRKRIEQLRKAYA